MIRMLDHTINMLAFLTLHNDFASCISVGSLNITTSCDAIYGFIEQLLVDLDVAEHCCLTVNSSCTNNGTSRTNYAKGVAGYNTGNIVISRYDC